MIIVKIQGGLGNQMFQYALGRSLSLANKTTFKIDSSYLRSSNQSNRSFLLDKFNTEAIEATDDEINLYISTYQKILDCFRPDSKKKKVLKQSSFFYPKILNRSDGYFDGHWNNEKYFKTHEKIIRNDFTLKNRLGEKTELFSKKILNEPQAVSIHMRRGDYVSIKKIENRHGVLPISYYENALKKIMEKFSNVKFFIFSDDIEWVRKNFPKKYPAVFVSNPDIPDYEELALMSLCKHNIIANSTFSWWGAWLNNNPSKIIIAPQKWFNDASENTKDLIPSSWIVL